MERYNTIIVFLILCIFHLRAWEKTYGGAYSDGGYSVKQTSDKGYIITGYTYSFGSGYSDIYLLKTDSLGNLEWSKTFGGEVEDMGFCVEETQDGYVLVGHTCSYGAGGYDILLIKVDLNGNLIWQKTYGSSSDQCGYEVEQTQDGGYIIIGYTQVVSNIYFLKTDSQGNIIWEKTYGGYNTDRGYSVEQTSDSGYIITGYTRSFGADKGDIYLAKLDSTGSVEWLRIFGGLESEAGYCVKETYDNSYVVVGYTNSYGSGGYDVYLIKVDSTGNLIWERTYGGVGNDFGYSLKETEDKGFIIVGWMDSPGANYKDVYLVKTDSSGNLLWEKTLGGTGDDYGYWIEITSDSGYVISGWTNSFGSGEYDVYLIKQKSLRIKESYSSKSYSFFIPTFFKDRIFIKAKDFTEKKIWLLLYNSSGILVFKSLCSFNTPLFILSDKKISNLPAGIYFLSLFLNQKKLKEVKLIKP